MEILDHSIRDVGAFEDEINRVKQQYKEAVAYQTEDPSTSLNKARKIAEDICKQLVEYELSENPSQLSLDQLINKLKNHRKILPSRITPAIYTIKNFANPASHALRVETEHITRQYAQPCLDSLTILVGWYVNTYRPTHAVVFTQGKRDWQHLKDAQQQLGIPLNVTFFERVKNFTRQELLELCRRFATVSQTTPLIVLIDREMPTLPGEQHDEALPYKKWGNNVFSVVLPHPAHRHVDEPVSIESYYPLQRSDPPDYTAFGEIFRILGSILQTVPRVPVENERRIDAAMPGQAERDRTIELLIQVRFPDSPLLGTAEWPTRQKPFSVEQRSQPVQLKFPVDRKTGKLSPTSLDVSINTTDFTIQGESKKRIEVSPDTLSELLIVPLTARKVGICRLYIDVTSVEPELHHLGTVLVETDVKQGRTSSVVQVTNFYFSVEVSPTTITYTSATAPLSSSTTEAETTSSLRPQHSGIISDIELVLKLNQAYLNTPPNKKIAQEISEELLLALAPVEASNMMYALEPLVEAETQGRSINPDIAGGWGGHIESAQVPIVMAIVPVVTAVLSTLFAEDQETVFQKILQWGRRRQNTVTSSKYEMLRHLTEQDISRIITHKGFSLSQEQIVQLTKHLKRILIHYLETL